MLAIPHLPLNDVAAYFQRVISEPWPDIDLGPELAGLPYRYATTVDGSTPTAVLQVVATNVAFEAGASGDYVATNIPILPSWIVAHRLVPISPLARQDVESWLDTWPTPTEGRARRAALQQQLPTFSEALSHEQKVVLARLYVMGEPYPEPSRVELGHPGQFAGLDSWYTMQRAGEMSRQPTAALLERLRMAPGFLAARSGDFLAVNGALPAKTIVEFGLLPIGETSRRELETWMERHATQELGEAQMEIDMRRGRSPSGDDQRFQVHMDTMLGYVTLLNAIMPRFGHQPVMIFDGGASSLHIGPIIAQQTAEGWKIGDFPYEEPDLTVPEGAAVDWNDVLDAALAARANQRHGDAGDSYLAVVNAAMQIRTTDAYEWVEVYSDTTSPAHEMAVQELARALNRVAELEVAGG